MINPENTGPADDGIRRELVQGQIVFSNDAEAAIIFANHISAVPDTELGILYLTFGQYATPNISGMTSEEIAKGINVPGRIVGKIAIPLVKFADFLLEANRLAPHWFATPQPDAAEDMP